VNILWLGEAGCHDRGLVGGKAAYLSQLAADHPVPPGFCLPATDGSLAELPAAYAELAARSARSEPSVAVRSSAVDEDGTDASFAGQHETYLNITGPDAVAEAIVRCRASASAPRALAYRQVHGLPTPEARVAVLVQQLVVADVSAVAFSANPVTGDRDQLVITASWGLGESIVGGTVTPDTFHLGKPDLAITRAQIAAKERMTVAIPGGTREVEIPRAMRTRPALSPEQVVDVGRLALRLEAQLGWPVDIECAFADGRLFLLQCRPITTLTSGPAAA
jgi:pyruvate,water dikinase